MNPWGVLIIAVGLFSAAGGYYNWNWFMNNHKARFVSTILTRTGARIFYVLLGIFLSIVGVVLTFEAVPISGPDG